MIADSEISTMDPAERVGYFGTFAVFLICGILLVVFGVRRLMRRSEMRKQQQYGYLQQHGYQPPYGAPSGGYPPQSPMPPSQSPYGVQGGGPAYGQAPYPQAGQQPGNYPPPNPYAPQPMIGKPPNIVLSIAMIVLGVFLLLATLGALAQGASGTA